MSDMPIKYTADVDAGAMGDELRAEFKATRDLHEAWSAQYGFTHTGSVERVSGTRLWWGLVHPNPKIYILNRYRIFMECDRPLWEMVTDMSPPWPWTEDGTGMDYEATF